MFSLLPPRHIPTLPGRGEDNAAPEQAVDINKLKSKAKLSRSKSVDKTVLTLPAAAHPRSRPCALCGTAALSRLWPSTLRCSSAALYPEPDAATARSVTSSLSCSAAAIIATPSLWRGGGDGGRVGDRQRGKAAFRFSRSPGSEGRKAKRTQLRCQAPSFRQWQANRRNASKST